jgi:hypothetical protein
LDFLMLGNVPDAALTGLGDWQAHVSPLQGEPLIPLVNIYIFTPGVATDVSICQIEFPRRSQRFVTWTIIFWSNLRRWCCEWLTAPSWTIPSLNVLIPFNAL